VRGGGGGSQLISKMDEADNEFNECNELEGHK
jgi:hypothetical protein